MIKYCLSLWFLLSAVPFIYAQDGISSITFSDDDAAQEEAVYGNNTATKNTALNLPVYFKDSKDNFDISIDNQSFNHTTNVSSTNNALALSYNYRLNAENAKEAHNNKRLEEFTKKISRDSAVTLNLNSAQNLIIYSKTEIHKKTNTPIAKLYAAKWKKSRWTNGKKIRFTNRKYSVNHPMLNAKETKLYFASDMPGGYGGMDLYVVSIYKNGKYSKPKNLGSTINTAADEDFPYIVDNYLYFSSDRVTGNGGLDLYEAILDQGKFTKAQNMGEPFNSQNDDFSFITNSTRDFGYFTSNREHENNVYAYHLKKKAATPNPELKSDPQAIEAVAQIDRETPPKITNVDVKEPEQKEKDYTTKPLKIITAKEMVELNATVELGIEKEDSKQAVFMESTIFYDYNDYNIRDSEKQYLDDLITLLNNTPNTKVKIESHADSSGSKAYNQLLSEMRSASVKHYLTNNGLSPDKIAAVVGFGEDRLLSKCTENANCHERNQQLDRRTEFVIVFN